MTIAFLFNRVGKSFRIAGMVFGAMLMLVGMAAAADQTASAVVMHTATASASFPSTGPLIAAPNVVIGTVTVWNDEEALHIRYAITQPNWSLTRTQATVDTTFGGILFPAPSATLATNHNNLTNVTLRIPLRWELGTQLYILPSATVQRLVGYKSSLASLDSVLALAAGGDGLIDLRVSAPGTAGEVASSLDATLLNSGSLNGIHDAWRVDAANDFAPGTTQQARIVSSYSPTAAPLVEQPWNLDLVNWLINQNFQGTASPCGGAYTYGDIQLAIWSLLGNEASPIGLGAFSQCRALELVNLAYARGDGFVPTCPKGRVAVLLNPVDANGAPTRRLILAQINLIGLQKTCTPLYQAAPAWGGDLVMPGNTGPRFFDYNLQ
ncbi:MAG: hypothetical protein SF339_11265 [Blastocatellia bacterium]|nr:hypothetical protein [Blastocatellia bacterium]